MYAIRSYYATDALITIIIDLIRAGLYGRFDLLDVRYATFGIAIGVVTIPGSWLAAFLVNRMGARLHRITSYNVCYTKLLRSFLVLLNL